MSFGFSGNIELKIALYTSRGPSWRSGTKCDCKTDWLWVRSPLEEMKHLLKFIFPFLRSGVEAKARRWVLPLNTQYLQNSAESGELLGAGYSVKLIYFLFIYNLHLVPSSYPAVCGIQREVDFLFYLFIFILFVLLKYSKNIANGIPIDYESNLTPIVVFILYIDGSYVYGPN